MPDLIADLRRNLARVIRGKDAELDLVITALLGNGSLLLTDVPGVGKTTLAKAVARSIGGVFHRVQFTPDLLPADITGGSIYRPQDGRFELRRGPIFANVLLADEINRASPRTQSALLEAMGERQVSIEGQTHELPRPFWVLATQNPIEFHGTYPLPEAQLDRFALELTLGYPPPADELKLLLELDRKTEPDDLTPVANLDAIVAEQARVAALHVDQDVSGYIHALVRATRADARCRLGASPRAAIALYRMAQAHAAVAGRTAVQPDDVKAVAVAALAHRLVLEPQARHGGATKADVVRTALERTAVPV